MSFGVFLIIFYILVAKYLNHMFILGCLVLTERKLCRFTSQKVSFICYMMTLIKVKKETPTDKCWTADSQTNVRQSVHCNTRQIVCTWELFFERLEKHSKLCKLYTYFLKMLFSPKTSSEIKRKCYGKWCEGFNNINVKIGLLLVTTSN